MKSVTIYLTKDEIIEIEDVEKVNWFPVGEVVYIDTKTVKYTFSVRNIVGIAEVNDEDSTDPV